MYPRRVCKFENYLIHNPRYMFKIPIPKARYMFWYLGTKNVSMI